MEKDEIFNNHFEEIKRELETKTKEKESLDQLKDKFSKTCMEKVHQEDNLNKLKESNDKLNSDLNKIIEDEKLMENLKPYCDKFDIFKEFKDSFLIFKNLKKEESRKNEVLERINENKEILLKEKENHDRFIELNAEIDQLKINEAQLVSEVKHAHDLENKKNEIINEISQVNKSMNDFYDNISDILSHLEIENPIDSIKNNQDLTDLDNIVKRHSEDYENKINQIDDDLKELNDEKVRLAQQSESIQEPLSNIKEVENKCPTCQSEISDDKKEELIRDYETTILNNNHRISEIDKLIDDLIIKKSSINEHSDDLKSILSNSKKMEIYINQADKLDGELEKIQAQISESQDMKLKLEELQPTLKSKVEESERLKINHDNYIKAQTLLDSLDDEIKVKKELETINLDIEKNEEDLKRIIDLDSKLSLQITEEELNEKINFLSKKQSDYDFLKGSVTRRERVEKDIKSNEDEIDSMIKSIEDLSETIESLGYDENNYQKVNKLVETLSNESNTLFTNIEVNRNQLKNIEEKISDIESKIEENKKYIDEFNDLNEYIELLNDFRWHYSKDGIQKDLRAQSKPLIQKYTRDFFEKFNFNYSDLILDDDYNISIYGPEGEIKLDMVSGGEEIAIALSLRLGITQVMSKGMIETILLDEPTIHLDQYRKQELIDVLRSMTVIPQMIIVTHDSELEPAADSIIKVKKENGISKVDDS
jgi:exonuclease SbcC